MIKKLTLILTLIVATLLPSVAKADAHQGDWRLFPAFTHIVDKVVDTPNRVYITGLPQAYASWASGGFDVKYLFLFVYDKSSDEMTAYTMRNKLNDNLIQKIAYNSKKGYLLIVYMNGNMDLLYDDDSVYNIPGLKSAVLRTDKNVNCISFDADNNRAYLTGKFGYIVIDDKKKEIAESHDYNTELFGIGRVGDKLIISTDAGLMQSPVSSKHYTLSDFTAMPETEKATHILELSDNSFAYVKPQVVKVTFAEDGTFTKETTINSSIGDVSEARDGYLLMENSSGILLKKNAVWPVYVTLPNDNKGKPYGSWDHTEFWTTNGTKGVGSKKYNSSDKSWSVNRADFMPNQPVVYRPWNITYSDKYGMLFCNEVFNTLYGNYSMGYWGHFNSFKNEVWSNHSPLYYDEGRMPGTYDPHGLTPDPQNEDLVWMGTFMHGFASLNLSNPNDTKFYSKVNDNDIKNLSGFHAVFASGWSCQVSKPEFDNDGTMWMAFNAEHRDDAHKEDVFFWRAEDRRNDDISKIGKFKVPNIYSKYNFILPLKHPKNKNLLVFSNNQDLITVIDTKGNPENMVPSNFKSFNTMLDQDGNQVRMGYVSAFYEDPETGNVWVANQCGTFDFAPSEAFNPDFRAHRCKIARNDGSNLADYLLDGIQVNRITSDGAGRKWFATSGAGAVLTSADGTEVIRQLTEENSYIPSNTVYGVACDPTSNKVWFGTENGIAEYTSDVAPSEDDYNNVKIYPNPVRPEFYDWVTIEGLMDNSLVKIVDAQGGLVRELGRSTGGMIKWDVCNLGGERVKSGVYYVMATQSDEGAKASKIGKILVIK